MDEQPILVKDAFGSLKKRGLFLFIQERKIKYRLKEGDLSDSEKLFLKRHQGVIEEYLERKSSRDRDGDWGAEPKQMHGGVVVPITTEQWGYLGTKIDGRGGWGFIWKSFLFEGEVSEEVLELALSALVQKHQALRMRINKAAAEPTLFLAEKAHQNLIKIDLSYLPDEAAKAEADRIASEMIKNRLEHRIEPHFASYLFTINPQKSLFVFGISHINADARSVEILTEDLSKIYSNYARGKGMTEEPSRVGYFNYASWQMDAIQHKRFDNDINYWRNYLRGASPLKLPTSQPETEGPVFLDARITISLDREMNQKLGAVAMSLKCRNISLYMAIIALVISSWTGRKDFLCGFVTARRTRPWVQRVVGFLSGHGVVKTANAFEDTFASAVAILDKDMASASIHQELPLHYVMEKALGIPLHTCAVMVNFLPKEQFTIAGGEKFAGLEVSPWTIPVSIRNLLPWQITVAIKDSEDGLRMTLTYSSVRQKAETMRRVAQAIRLLLDKVIENPQQQCVSLSAVISPVEGPP